MIPHSLPPVAATDITKLLRNHQFWDAIWAGLLDSVGLMLFIAIMGTFYFVSLWWYTGSIFPPAIVLTLYGGTIIMGAPPPLAIAGGLVVTIALAFAYYVIFGRRY